MIRRPPRSTLSSSSAASDVYKRQLSGLAINQFRLYAPEVLDSFRKLAETGMVAFLAETNSHSLVSLKSRSEFERQVNKHQEMMKEFLGVESTSFRNTELIYS